jgi:hypothetical protein
LRWPGIFLGLSGDLFIVKTLYNYLRGRLDHQGYPTTWDDALYFLAAACLAVGLAGLRQTHPEAKGGLNLSFAGLVWLTVTGVLSLFVRDTPWGLYSLPGFVLAVVGIVWTGVALRRAASGAAAGTMLLTAALSVFVAMTGSALLFNLLGRDLQAQQAATLWSTLFCVAAGALVATLGFRTNKAR